MARPLRLVKKEAALGGRQPKAGGDTLDSFMQDLLRQSKNGEFQLIIWAFLKLLFLDSHL
jgi:hypothetical protein